MAGNPLDFLDTKHRLWTQWVATWRLNERRAFGQVTDDLMRFIGETDERYAVRQDRASYVNFMQMQAQPVTGQLRAQGAPTPENGRFSFGSLGVIRPAEQVRGVGSFGELTYYNVDGVGDASEWPVFFDAVDERAQHIGHRPVMIEAPPAHALTPNQSAAQEEPAITLSDVLAGRRPYALEFNTGQLTMWARRSERFEFCILRVPQESGRVVDGAWVEPAQVDAAGNGLGYYLLVRAGCQLLGPEYAAGGYWLYRSDKKLLRSGRWNALSGEIPLWYHYGLKSKGTELKPAESQSTTEGLGRIGVSLMDTMSARDWDAFDAAGSRKWLLNANAETMSDVKVQWDARSQNIGVPPAFDETAGESHAVEIYDDSAGAVAPQVFQAIIDAKFAEAREQSFRTLTSSPDASGAAWDASFRATQAPYLARRATLRQQSEQTAVRNFELRYGRSPTGYAFWKRDYSLSPVVQELDDALNRLRMNGLRSPTMEPELAIRMIKQRLGGLPQPTQADPAAVVPPAQYEEQVRAELRESVTVALAQSAQDTALANTFGG